MECNHKYTHLDTESWHQSTGHYSRKYTLVDRFFCEKCLEIKEVKKEQSFDPGESYNLPNWAKAITREIF